MSKLAVHGDQLHVLAGVRIREAREAMGFTQETLAQLVGASRELVNAWETGRGVPSGTRLAKLATVLRRDPGFFFLSRPLAADEALAPAPAPTGPAEGR